MKQKWLWIAAAVLVVAVIVLVLRLTVFAPETDPDPIPTPSDTTPTTTTTTAPVEDVVTPANLHFTGKVLEVDGDSVLMECYDEDKFGTVWVNYAQILSVTPQIGEEYIVVYEDLIMPSLPPRITAVEMVKQRTPVSTGEALYNDIVGAVISAYPWGADPAASAIPNHPEMSYMYFRNKTLSEVGYVQLDLDGNGQTELLIGDVNMAAFPYDCFTIKDGELVHLFASEERNSFTVLENGYLQNSWFCSAACGGDDYYRLVDGELQFLERVTHDAYYALEIGLIGSLQEANETNCYFHTTIKNEDDEYEGYRSITADKCDEIQKKYNDYKDIEISYYKLS